MAGQRRSGARRLAEVFATLEAILLVASYKQVPITNNAVIGTANFEHSGYGAVRKQEHGDLEVWASRP
jgi:hypothetical protein